MLVSILPKNRTLLIEYVTLSFESSYVKICITCLFTVQMICPKMNMFLLNHFYLFIMPAIECEYHRV